MLIVLAVVASAVWAGAAEVQPSTLAIGLLLPPGEPDADSFHQGALLAVEEANRLPGTPAKLVVRGRHGQWGADGEDAAALALDDEVGALITPSDGAAAHQVLQVAGRTRVPVASLCPDSSVTRTGIPWLVQVVPGTEDEVRTILAAPVARSVSPGRHWTAVVPRGRAGREAARDLSAAARAAGCHLEPPVPFPSESRDLPPMLRQLLELKPDGIALWVDARAAADLARSLRQLGFSGVLAGPSWLQSPTFLQAAGAAARGVLVAAVKPDDRRARSFQTFQQNFRTRFGREPDYAAVPAYDAATLLVRVLREAGGDPAYRQFPLGHGSPGILGGLRFDATGRRMVTLEVRACADGRFAPLAGAYSAPGGSSQSRLRPINHQ